MDSNSAWFQTVQTALSLWGALTGTISLLILILRFRMERAALTIEHDTNKVQGYIRDSADKRHYISCYLRLNNNSQHPNTLSHCGIEVSDMKVRWDAGSMVKQRGHIVTGNPDGMGGYDGVGITFSPILHPPVEVPAFSSVEGYLIINIPQEMQGNIFKVRLTLHTARRIFHQIIHLAPISQQR